MDDVYRSIASVLLWFLSVQNPLSAPRTALLKTAEANSAPQLLLLKTHQTLSVPETIAFQ